MIQIINGPNLNLLGKREPEIYGQKTLAELETELRARGEKFGLKVAFFQSNSEGELIDYIQGLEENAPVIINAGGYAHTSVALRDAILATKVDAIEVHISNTGGREGFRQKSFLADVCRGSIMGLGTHGYGLALDYFIKVKNSKL